MSIAVLTVTSNEKEMSCGGRGHVSFGAEVLKSSQNVDPKRPAVRLHCMVRCFACHEEKRVEPKFVATDQGSNQRVPTVIRR